MKKAKLLHNPGAGDEPATKKELIRVIESGGYECDYFSTKKKNWEVIDPDIDFVVVAGGDGTVRKIVKQLVNRTMLDKRVPLAVLCMGTANNIAKTLGISSNHEEAVQSWSRGVCKRLDIGKINGIPEQTFFLEGAGYGVFPKLVKTMKDLKPDSSLDPIAHALQVLEDIVRSYRAKNCEIEIDGMNYSGDYLLVEMMNICSVGPNLELAPDADPTDGTIEVVMIKEEQREQLVSYISGLRQGIIQPAGFTTAKAKNVKLQWGGKLLHVDDELIEVERQQELKVELLNGAVEFMVPRN